MDLDINIPDDVRRRYIDRRKADIEILHSAIAGGRFEEFKRIGHQLKGNAASFGYPDLEKVAIRMEEAGERADRSAAQLELRNFESWLENICAG